MDACLFVIDDDEAYRTLVGAVLESHCGVPEVHLHARGDEAIAALLALPAGRAPVLLLIDYHMPGMDAPVVLRALRAAGVRVPAVIISSTAGADEQAACLREGAREFVRKPARAEELVAVLRRLVATYRQEAQGGP